MGYSCGCQFTIQFNAIHVPVRVRTPRTVYLIELRAEATSTPPPRSVLLHDNKPDVRPRTTRACRSLLVGGRGDPPPPRRRAGAGPAQAKAAVNLASRTCEAPPAWLAPAVGQATHCP